MDVPQKGPEGLSQLAKGKNRTARQLQTAIDAQLLIHPPEHGIYREFFTERHAPVPCSAGSTGFLTTVYEQCILYEAHSHSISPSHCEPEPALGPANPNGKSQAKTEFGPKLHLSLVDGYARMERLSFEAFYEPMTSTILCRVITSEMGDIRPIS